MQPPSPARNAHRRETYTLSGYFSASSHLRWSSGARLEAVVQGGGAEQTVLLTDARRPPPSKTAGSA